MLQKSLIILHGWGGSHETWADFVQLAKRQFTHVQVIDLPCFGDEPCPTEIWGVEEYAGFVQEKIKKIQQEKQVPVVLLGHSFGGQVASYLVANNAHICEYLVLTGAAVYRIKKVFKKRLFGAIASMGKVLFRLPILRAFESLAKKILYRAASSPDYLNTAGIQRDIFKKIITQDMSHCLSKIMVPTFVIWGEKDGYVPASFGHKIAKAIPDAQFALIPNGTHGLHIKKKQALLDNLIHGIIKREDPQNTTGRLVSFKDFVT